MEKYKGTQLHKTQGAQDTGRPRSHWSDRRSSPSSQLPSGSGIQQLSPPRRGASGWGRAAEGAGGSEQGQPLACRKVGRAGTSNPPRGPALLRAGRAQARRPLRQRRGCPTRRRRPDPTSAPRRCRRRRGRRAPPHLDLPTPLSPMIRIFRVVSTSSSMPSARPAQPDPDQRSLSRLRRHRLRLRTPPPLRARPLAACPAHARRAPPARPGRAEREKNTRGPRRRRAAAAEPPGVCLPRAGKGRRVRGRAAELRGGRCAGKGRGLPLGAGLRASLGVRSRDRREGNRMEPQREGEGLGRAAAASPARGAEAEPAASAQGEGRPVRSPPALKMGSSTANCAAPGGAHQLIGGGTYRQQDPPLLAESAGCSNSHSGKPLCSTVASLVLERETCLRPRVSECGSI